MRGYTSSHWGIYEIHGDASSTRLRPLASDPDPSPIGAGMLQAYRDGPRVLRPAIRRSVARHGPGAAPELRGREPFVEVGWEEALELTASMLRDTMARSGNEAIFGGSYGWASAGRFHHAQSQVHRFLNCIGGYVRSVDTYSLGAGRVLMPRVVAPMDALMQQHTSWDVLAKHTQLFVAFGGVPARNAQIHAGGSGRHAVAEGLRAMAAAGVKFINISPVRDDLETGGPVEWIPVRPHSDTALMLGIAHTLAVEGRHDRTFLQRYCVGYERFEAYLLGRSDGQPKTAAWAEQLTGVPAHRIARLAHQITSRRTMLNAAWSLQRAHHGEQPFWMLVTLAAMVGQIGLPGAGFGVGYGASGMMGLDGVKIVGPTMPQGRNPVAAFIPVARITDMLERPGEAFAYDGGEYRYPRVELIYWAGGNPFHHHQDLPRLAAAWRHVPQVVTHEQFWTASARMSDVVLPATCTLEREDIGFATRDRFLVAMVPAMEPRGEARDDHIIFRSLAARLGAEQAFTEGLQPQEWMRRMYDGCRDRAHASGVDLPDYDAFRAQGLVDLGSHAAPVVMLEAFRSDPSGAALATPSGLIEIYSENLAGFGLADCPGHACWLEPREWLGNTTATYPLHLLSDQPRDKLHSQLDDSALSREKKVRGREPIMISEVDAKPRGIRTGDLVRIWNARGACLAGAIVSTGIAPGVIKLSTGAWFDPASWDEPNFDKHGNPNVLTADEPASSLSQGCAAQTCLVQIERFDEAEPVVTAFRPPAGVSSISESQPSHDE
ncbi:molybdopterin-dependent oxidoreductase [Caenimonas sp. S4]|nr:molybdopterin-dependent oxidoreductase [Caenimonas soli]